MKRFRVETSKSVDKFLEKNRDIAKKYINSIEILSVSLNENSLDIKKLKGEKNKYRLRIGKYRFLYEIVDSKILIFFYDAGSRGGIYKNK